MDVRRRRIELQYQILRLEGLARALAFLVPPEAPDELAPGAAEIPGPVSNLNVPPGVAGEGALGDGAPKENEPLDGAAAADAPKLKAGAGDAVAPDAAACPAGAPELGAGAEPKLKPELPEGALV